MAREDSQFKNGNLGGPGRHPLRPELKELKSLNQFEFHKILNDLIYKTKSELQLKINDPTTTSLELAVASVLAKSISTGDPVKLSYITDRLVGKPKENIEIQMRPYQELDDEELVRRIATAEGRKTLSAGTPEIQS